MRMYVTAEINREFHKPRIMAFNWRILYDFTGNKLVLSLADLLLQIMEVF